MHMIDDMHRFAIPRTATPPMSPPMRFGTSTVNDFSSSPDLSPSTKSVHRLSSHSSTLSLNSGYHSPMNYPLPLEPPTAATVSSTTPAGIEPGVYEIKSHLWASTVDLSGGDHKSVIAWNYHGHANQQWEFLPLGKGWSIKSLSNNLYLTVEKELGSGVPIIASEYPVSWTVEVDSSNVGLVRILWPNSETVWEMQDGRRGTPVKLANRYPQESHDRKIWELIPVSKKTQSPEHFSPKSGVTIREPDRRGHDHFQRHSWLSSSDSDSDASYTIVKTITKTKTKSRSKNSKFGKVFKNGK